ncbi:MAG: STAS domain-containing protein [Acidimicrobiia bacterium]|nr:STAS domain-containing protein [Acidimicrobiia bacterium]
MPTSVLGAVIVFAATGLIDPAAWRSLARDNRRELAIAAVTTAGVLTAGILPALLDAVALSILDAVARSSRPHDAVLGYVPRLERWADVRLHPSARLAPGILVYRLDDRLFFANAEYVKGRLREALAGAPGEVRWVVLDAESLVTVDTSGLAALRELVRELHSNGVSFAIARARGSVIQLLADAGLVGAIGHEHVYPTVRAAVTTLAPTDS